MTVTPTSRGADALACLRAAVAEATRLSGVAGLRDERAMMTVPNSVGATVRQAPVPIAVVSDNGPCFRSETFAQAFAGHDPLLRQVRTRGAPRRPTASWRGSSAP